MLKCSHILCKVAHIGDCVNALEEAGFQVQWGGEAGQAHNALVWFADGPFLEFFELPGWCRLLSGPFGWRFGRSAGQRLAQWAGASPGWCDVALEPQDIAPLSPLDLLPVSDYLRSQALSGSRLISGSRRAAEGGKVRYRFMTPGDPHLPFIVSHYDPPQRPGRIDHPNGARAVTGVHFHLPQASHRRLQRLLPEDRWLQGQISEQRYISGVILEGWQPLPLTSPFIHSLFASREPL